MTMKQLTLENDVLRVTVCPSLGGKITSFYLKEKEFELAAQSSEAQCEARHRMLEKSVIDSFGPYAYGMDDCFPNVDGELVEWKNRKLFYPNHGEIWNHEFVIQERADDRVSLSWYSTVFDYLYEKKVRLEKNTLSIQYHIVNTGDEELPCIWTWHGLVLYEQDMEILLPESITHYRNVLDESVLGTEGSVYPVQNDVYDFSRMPNPDICNMVKYYGEEPSVMGRCGIYYPSKDVSYHLKYDACKLPYFGVWITAGGMQGDYNCALEPTNGYYDSIGKANKNQKLPVLSKGEILNFTLELTLKEGR